MNSKIKIVGDHKYLIAWAIDKDMYKLMVSLDLSSALDMVITDFKQDILSIINLPNDFIPLVSNWLWNRFFHVSVDSIISDGYSCGDGLGFLALFVSPLLDLVDIAVFAGDNYVSFWNKHIIA